MFSKSHIFKTYLTLLVMKLLTKNVAIEGGGNTKLKANKAVFRIFVKAHFFLKTLHLFPYTHLEGCVIKHVT